MSGGLQAGPRRGLRAQVKAALNAAALLLVSPVVLMCRAEAAVAPASLGAFLFWAQVVALVPGTPGVFVRRAFYRWTLEACGEDLTVGFGTLFSRRSSRLGRSVYIGPYALIGSASIGDHALIGSPASLLSGGQQHRLLPSGQWSATESSQLTRIDLGANTWIGEGAILMADVGAGCMVAAGSVVSTPVPPAVMVAGNPARFVRRLVSEESAESERTTHGVALSAVR